jgi:enediyne biosynthesis protein E5
VGEGRTQHIFNPSNFGVALTLILFPYVGFAPPYQFTENITGNWNWILPIFILATGIIIHGCFTGRLSLIAAWIIGFALQGEVRAYFFHTPAVVPLMPMTSAAFVLFTLYMVPDPATTPLKPWRQAAFGFSVAAVYGIIQVLHLVFGLFFALLVVCAIRGISLYLYYFLKSPSLVAAIGPADPA